MKASLKGFLFYILLFFVGYFIYQFQIEKSFNLLSIYFLCISFSLVCFVFNIESKKSLPLLFLFSLFWMYGVRFDLGKFVFDLEKFLILMGITVLFLVILLPRYSLFYKKILFAIATIAVASIYIFQEQSMIGFSYIPYVIGSFFMFRSISYLHELKFLKKPSSVLDDLNYFLLPSNFSLPLFPIVDYKSFISSYEGINISTLERSSLFIIRGVFQLLLYRIVYHHIIVPITDLHTASQILIYLIANFMIVLRVIGAFHIAIGLVILSGYNIPDLFNNIFFSTGFSNLWRRTNMYWKNFVIKIFYYPIYFKIKKIGIYSGLFISTFVCFFITWFLHTYQWFWLKGSFPIKVKDAIFWGSFGLLVAVNTLLQQKELDRSSKTKKRVPVYDFFIHSVYGLIVFIVMSILWSIWTSSNLASWWSVISIGRNINLHELIICLSIFAGYILIASTYHYYQKFKDSKLNFIRARMKYLSYVGFVFFILIIYAAKYVSKYYSNWNYEYLRPIIEETMNKADLINMDNGYYSNLISTNNFCSQTWQNENDITKKWTIYNVRNMTRPTNDLMLVENIANKSYRYRDITYSINADGLHDKLYPRIKPDSCYRIIVLGGSYEAGNGMSDDKDFISIVEKRLNQEYDATINGQPKHIELVNFSVNGYRLIQRYYLYKNIARLWHPDALLLFIHSQYFSRSAGYVYRLVSTGFKIDDPYLSYVIAKTRINKEDDGGAVQTKLGFYADSLNYYAVHGIVMEAKKDSAKVVATFLPSLMEPNTDKDSTFLRNICRINNMNVMHLDDVFKGINQIELCLSDEDYHPNKKANDLIANKLLENIILHQDYFNIKFTKK